MSVCIYVCVFMYICVFVCVSMCICMYVCVLCMHVFVCLCVCGVCMYVLKNPPLLGTMFNPYTHIKIAPVLGTTKRKFPYNCVCMILKFLIRGDFWVHFVCVCICSGWKIQFYWEFLIFMNSDSIGM